ENGECGAQALNIAAPLPQVLPPLDFPLPVIGRKAPLAWICRRVRDNVALLSPWRAPGVQEAFTKPHPMGRVLGEAPLVVWRSSDGYGLSSHPDGPRHGVRWRRLH